jgi:trypsin-like peptidase/AAA ATPase-like protein
MPSAAVPNFLGGYKVSQRLGIFERRTWLARIWKGGDARKSVCGVAFALSPNHLLTCAHVVAEAGAGAPNARLYVDFPLLEAEGSWAVVLAEGWRPMPRLGEPQSAGDIALLELEDPPSGIEPLPLAKRTSYKGMRFATYGFPQGHPESDVAHGILGLHVGLEWVRVEADSVALIEPGFSGAPVWADGADAAVAMILTRRNGDTRVAYAVPLDVAAASSQTIAERFAASDQPLHWLDKAPPRLNAELISFARMIEDRTVHFVGREFVFSALENRLRHSEARAGYIFVRGKPGIGKSALMGQLAHTRGYAHHFNIATENVRSPERFLKNACAQLILRYGLPYEELPPNSGEDSRTLETLLAQSVECARQNDDLPVVLLVDALDEAETPRAGVNRLFLPHRLPDGAFIVATIRINVDERLDVAQRLEDIVFDETAKENEDDIKAYISEFLHRHKATMTERLAQWKIDESGFVQTLWLQSEGNFMYLRHVLPDIVRGMITHTTIRRLQDLPAGLRDYYKRHWLLMKDQDRVRFRRLQRPVLCFLAKAREAVPASAIAEWINESGSFDEVEVEEVEDVLQDWAEFIDEDPGSEPRYRLYHNSFLDFLEDEEDLKRYARAKAKAMRDKVDWDAD